MASRERVIAQKRATLREEMNGLVILAKAKPVNFYDVRTRFERINKSFNAYEEMHDELVVSNLDAAGQDEMKELKELFYQLSAYYAQIQHKFDQPNVNANAPSVPMGHSTFLEKQKQLKLPIANLPKFRGEVEHWWSFKRSFQSMVGSRTDIDKVVKFHYLKGCLEGKAANKLRFYDPSEANYDKAWEVLTEAYERKRMLIYKHLDMLLDISPLKQVTEESVGDLIDSARQNVHALELVDCKIPDIVIVRTLEKALPLELRTKWEESLSRDEIPSFKKFDEFLVDTASRMQTLESDAKKKGANGGGKRPGDSGVQDSKPKNRKLTSRSLVTAVTACPLCQGDHPLYKCPTFEKSNLQQRWDVVKEKQLCKNCLRKHEGQCNSSRRCKICNKFHHSSLHNAKTSKPAGPASSSSSSTSHSESKSSA